MSTLSLMNPTAASRILSNRAPRSCTPFRTRVYEIHPIAPRHHPAHRKINARPEKTSRVNTPADSGSGGSGAPGPCLKRGRRVKKRLQIRDLTSYKHTSHEQR